MLNKIKDKTHKRSSSSIPIFLDEALFKELEDFVNEKHWDYKSVDRELYFKRDKALISLLILSGLRASEIIKLKKLQFRIYKDRIILANAITLKRNDIRKKIILPKLGRLGVFTTIFEEWLQEVNLLEDFVFCRALDFKRNIGRYRVFQIVTCLTNRFPHWFRAVHENIYGKIVFKNNAWKLKEFMGYKSINSSVPYVNPSWEENEKDIFKV